MFFTFLRLLHVLRKEKRFQASCTAKTDTNIFSCVHHQYHCFNGGWSASASLISEVKNLKHQMSLQSLEKYVGSQLCLKVFQNLRFSFEIDGLRFIIATIS